MIAWLIALISFLGFVLLKPYAQYVLERKGKNFPILFYPLHGAPQITIYFKQKYGDIHKGFEQIFKKNPNVKSLLSSLFGKRVYVLFEPEYIKSSLVENSSVLQKLQLLLFDKEFSALGLVDTEGEKWKKQRKFLNELFHFQKLKSYVPTIIKVVESNLDLLKQNPKMIQDEGIYSLTFNITGDTIVTTFFGIKNQKLIIDNLPITKYISKVFNEIAVQSQELFTFIRMQLCGKYINYFLTPYEKQLRQKIDIFQNVIKNLIEERLKQKQENPGSKQTEDLIDHFVDAYLKEKEDQTIEVNLKLSVKEIIHQFVTFFVAGTDTTGTLIAQCLYFLSKYQQYQDEIIDESKKIVGDKNYSDMNIDDIKNHKVLDAFIKEVLRYKTPILENFFRVATKDVTMTDLKIRKNDIVQVYFMNGLNPKYFPNPDQFMPERWLNDDQIMKEPFSYTPFSAGPRNCIGQHLAMIETKIALLLILNRYQIESDGKPMRFKYEFFLQMEDPYNSVRFIERN